MTVARGNPQTAWALLQELDTGTLVVALLLQATLAGAPFLALVGYTAGRIGKMTAGLPPRNGGDDDYLRSAGFLLGYLLFFILCYFATSWLIALAIVIVILIGNLVIKSDSGSSPPKPPLKARVRSSAPFVVARFAILVAIIPILFAPLWVPTEVFEIGEQRVVVQVLREAGEDQFVVYVRGNNRVARLDLAGTPDKPVEYTREICEPSFDVWAAPLSWLPGSRSYPDCP